MTKEEVIAMARESGLIGSIANGFDRTNLTPAEERFAKLIVDDYSNKHSQLWRVCIEDVVKAEREACAKMCDEIVARYRHADDAPEMVAANWCADSVRARGSV